jgi:hypothetical protein
MKNTCVTLRSLQFSVAGVLLATLALPAAAIDLKTSDGSWTFSLNGNVNVDYIWSSCESATSAVQPNPPSIVGGLTCIGSASGSNVSNITNGLLPAAFAFGVATTQAGFDITAHLGLYPPTTAAARTCRPATATAHPTPRSEAPASIFARCT